MHAVIVPLTCNDAGAAKILRRSWACIGRLVDEEPALMLRDILGVGDWGPRVVASLAERCLPWVRTSRVSEPLSVVRRAGEVSDRFDAHACRVTGEVGQRNLVHVDNLD